MTLSNSVAWQSRQHQRRNVFFGTTRSRRSVTCEINRLVFAQLLCSFVSRTVPVYVWCVLFIYDLYEWNTSIIIQRTLKQILQSCKGVDYDSDKQFELKKRARKYEKHEIQRSEIFRIHCIAQIPNIVIPRIPSCDGKEKQKCWRNVIEMCSLFVHPSTAAGLTVRSICSDLCESSLSVVASSKCTGKKLYTNNAKTEPHQHTEQADMSKTWHSVK